MYPDPNFSCFRAHSHRRRASHRRKTARLSPRPPSLLLLLCCCFCRPHSAFRPPATPNTLSTDAIPSLFPSLNGPWLLKRPCFLRFLTSAKIAPTRKSTAKGPRLPSIKNGSPASTIPFLVALISRQSWPLQDLRLSKPSRARESARINICAFALRTAGTKPFHPEHHHHHGDDGHTRRRSATTPPVKSYRWRKVRQSLRTYHFVKIEKEPKAPKRPNTRQTQRRCRRRREPVAAPRKPCRHARRRRRNRAPPRPHTHHRDRTPRPKA